MTLATTSDEVGGFELRELWRRYGKDDSTARERLVLHYSPLVKQIAGRLGSQLPAHIEVGDLISAGLMGLLGAIERFEPERKIKFETYASTRIRGAMLDALRSMDWVPRKVREDARDLEQMELLLNTRLGRSPTEAELADGLGLEVEALRHNLLEIDNSRILSFDAPTAVGNSDASSHDLTLKDYVSNPGIADPQSSLDDNEKATAIRVILADAIGALPEREQFIIACRYRDELRLGEIGEVMHLTESRISQLHARALVSLRAAVKVAGGDLRLVSSVN